MAIRYLSGVNIDSNTLFVDDANNRVGIGTASPNRTLSVHSAASSVMADFKYTAGGFSSIILSNTLGSAHLASVVNDLLISPAGTERMRITSAGNVGIGTTSPDYKLDIDYVDTSISSNPTLRIRNAWTGEGNNIGFSNKSLVIVSAGNDTVVTKIQSRYDSGANIGQVGTTTNHDFLITTNNLERLRLDTSGNLKLSAYGAGILTTDASGNVSVDTTTYIPTTDYDDFVNVTGDTMTGGLNIEVSTSNTQLKLKRTTSATGEFNIYTNTDSLFFQNVGQSTYPMMINSSGNVGIGTTSPTYKLDVSGSGANDSTLGLTATTDTSYSLVRLVGDASTYDKYLIGYNSAHVSQPNQLSLKNLAGAINFFTGASGSTAERMRIDASGNVGIGTTSPDYNLEVENTSNSILNLKAGITSSSQLLFSDTDANAVGGIHYYHSANLMGIYTNGSEQMRITSGGNVGIGTTAPSTKFDVEGYARFAKQFREGGFSALGATVDDWYTIASFSLNSAVNTYENFKGTVNWGYGGTTSWYAVEFDIYFRGAGSIAADGAYVRWSYRQTGNAEGKGGSSIRIIRSGDVTYEVQVSPITNYGIVNWEVISPKYSSAITITTYDTLQTASTALSSTRIVQDSNFYVNGNVGIGTTSPDQRLQIHESSSSAAYLKVTNTTTGEDGGNGALFGISSTEDAVVWNYENTATRFGTNGSERMRITSGGNVGIGTTNPLSKLHVSDATDISMASGGDGQFRVEGSGYTGAIALDATAMYLYHNSASRNLVLGTNETAAISIHKSNQSLDFNAYGAGGFKGDATYVLGVDSSGNVVETTTAGVYFGTNTANGTYTNQWQRVLVIGTSNFDSQGFRLRIEGTGNTSGQSIVAEIEFNYKNQNGAIRARTTVNSYGTRPVDKDDVAVYFDTTNLEATFYFKVKENYTLPIYSIASGRIRDYAFYSNVIGDDAALALETNDSITSNLKFQGIVQDQDSGLVGVGTSAPNTRLSVDGDLSFLDSNGTTRLTVGNVTTSSPFESKIYTGNYHLVLQAQGSGQGDIKFRTGTTSASDRMIINSSGNVGIGTTSPNAPLSVHTTQASLGQRIASFYHTDGTNNPFLEVNSIAQGVQIKTGFSTGINGQLDLYTAGGNSFITLSTAASERVRITSTGNVGIGTTSPTYKLHVTDSTADGRAVQGIQSATSGTNYGAVFKATGSGATKNIGLFADATGATTNYAAIFDNGNVGIGTADPLRDLHVKKSNSGGQVRLEVNNSSDTADSHGVVSIYSGGSNSGDPFLHLKTGATGIDWSIGIDNSDSDKLKISKNFGPGTNDYLTVNTSGNVGIGTTNPGAKLDVAGSILAQSSGYIQIRVDQTDSGMIDMGMTSGTAEGFLNVQNTGAGHVATAPEFKVLLNASEKMRIDSSGNVGIGTTSPAYTLDVKKDVDTWLAGVHNTGSDANAQALLVRSDATGAHDAAVLGVYADGGYKMMVRSTGNVGIGTISPTKQLHVNGSYKLGTNAYIQYDASYPYTINIQNTASAGDIKLQSANGENKILLQPSTGGIDFHTNNSERMRITDGGNVGIGTTAPNQKLEVAGRVRATTDPTFEVYNTSTNRGGFQWVDSSVMTKIFSGGSSGAAAGIILETNTTEKMRITSDGNVGIGTTSPDSKFHVEDTNPEVRITGTGGTSFPRLLWEYPVSATQASRWALTGGASANIFYLYNYTQSKKVFQVDGTASHITLNHDAAGTTQIGTSTTQTAYQLYVKTNVGQTGAIEASGAVKITSGALGVNIAASATAGRIDASNDIVAYSTSDYRLKENIKPLENATEKVKKLTGVEFDWKQEHKAVHGYEGHDVGVIAQEVQEVLPEAIRTNDSGYLSVRYEKLIGLLIESNKELAARVEELEQKLKQ